MSKRSEHLDELLGKLNHEALFNPDLELRAQFQDLYEIATRASTDHNVLLQELTNRDLGWIIVVNDDGTRSVHADTDHKPASD